MNEIKQSTLYAGNFSTWLRNIRKALAENRGMNVPCGECDACCRSSYFIHITPKDIRALRKTPKDLLFPAPLLPQGYMVLGYDKQGRCPMLVGNKCSIYKDRPATCHSFDCRILAATGITGNDNNLIAQQARRWKFGLPTKNDRNLFLAVQTSAAFLSKHPECILNNLAPRDEIQVAVLAIKVYDVFINKKVSTVHHAGSIRDSDIVKEVVKSYKKFEKRRRAV